MWLRQRRPGQPSERVGFGGMAREKFVEQPGFDWSGPTQATLSRLLRLAGVNTLIDGFGRLMQEF